MPFPTRFPGEFAGKPPNPIVVGGLAAAIGCALIPKCRENLADINRAMERWRNQADRKGWPKALKSLGEQLTKMEGEKKEDEEDKVAPATPEGQAGDGKGPPLTEYWDLDSAAEAVFGKGTKVVTDDDGNPVRVDGFGDVKNQDIRDKIKDRDYDPADYEMNTYDVIKPDGNVDTLSVAESKPGKSQHLPYLAPHDSSSGEK